MMIQPYYERDNVTLYCGDNREVLPALDVAVSAVVTDPPYGLSFMGRDWDHAVPGEAFWRIISDAMLPGAHLLSFGGTRTFHRIAVAIEDAGLELRDTLMWLYGSGFPKSHDVSKAIDKVNGEGDRAIRFTRWMRGTGLTRSRATDILRDAGLISENGTMAGHFFASSQAGQPAIPTPAIWAAMRPHIDIEIPAWVDELIDRVEAEREVIGRNDRPKGWFTAQDGHDITVPATPAAHAWHGWGTALKPAHEPIILARKPLSGTVAANVLQHGTGALNIDASRIAGPGAEEGRRRHGGGIPGNGTSYELPDSHGEQPAGRWPANVLLDEDAAAALDAQSGVSTSQGGKHSGRKGTRGNVGGYGFERAEINRPTDTGGASRFFYVAKASRRERNAGLDGMPERPLRDGGSEFGKMTMWNGENGDDAWRKKNPNNPSANHHPTVKPLALMRYLITLVTPPGGVVLDPFAGSGTTGVACAELGVPCILIEQSPEYCEIIARRIDHALNERAGAVRQPALEMVAD